MKLPVPGIVLEKIPAKKLLSGVASAVEFGVNKPDKNQEVCTEPLTVTVAEYVPD
ncbi:hypothetical protein [Acidovorax sp.]|uniref:hypothetical protein n=1 Tax=Acidovorax sp. TaxID=1872122 RepID=UPI0026147C49|nr:hypothetical protein [Acidovorax sp.]